MSKCKEFQRCVLYSFSKFGFLGNGRTRKYSGTGVDIIINVQSANIHCFVNVGFIIHEINDIGIKNVEKSHMYFRLERIFNEYKDVICGASQISEADSARKLLIFTNLIESELAEKLCKFAEINTLRRAFSSGIFLHGIITREARRILSSK